MSSPPLCVHIRSRGEWIKHSVLAPEFEQHQLRVVRQLQAEPVPTRLFVRKLVSEKFVVHPGRPRDLKTFPMKLNGAGSEQTREGNVVRSVPRPFRFLA